MYVILRAFRHVVVYRFKLVQDILYRFHEYRFYALRECVDIVSFQRLRLMLSRGFLRNMNLSRLSLQNELCYRKALSTMTSCGT